MKHPPELKYEYFDVTADIGFRAYGKTLSEAFENAAKAMFEVMTDISQISPDIEKTINITAEDEYALLYDWLEEMLFLHDTEYLIFCQFQVEIIKEDDIYHLKSKLWGSEFNPQVHVSLDEVKAVTYHLMKIERNKEFMVQVILDT